MSFVFHSSFAIFTSRRPPSAPPRASDVRRWEFGVIRGVLLLRPSTTFDGGRLCGLGESTIVASAGLCALPPSLRPSAAASSSSDRDVGARSRGSECAPRRPLLAASASARAAASSSSTPSS